VKLLVALAFALGLAAPIVVNAISPGSAAAETRAALGGVVVAHVDDLLSDRYDAAWARIHPADRQAVGRELWERCKRSPDGSLRAVRYKRIRVTSERPMTFASRLHDGSRPSRSR
jgi:hypothetical protein